MSKVLSAPLNVVLSITNNCNLKCLHCFSSASRNNNLELEFQNWKKIIPLLINSKIFSVRYSGGEPLSAPWFFDIAEQISNHKINSGINTNATLVTKDLASRLKKLPIREGAIVGIDGLKESHEKLRGFNTYASAIRGIENLVSADIHVEMFCVVTQLNYDEIEDIYMLAKQIGVSRLNFNKLCVVGRSVNNQRDLVLSTTQQKQVYDRLLSISDETLIKGVLYEEAKLYYKYDKNKISSGSKNIGCGNGSTGLVIYSNGDCAPCEMIGRNAICGNLFYDSLESIWRSSAILNDFRALSNVQVDNINGCKDCKVRNICSGTCRAEAYVKGDILGKGSICARDVYEMEEPLCIV